MLHFDPRQLIDYAPLTTWSGAYFYPVVGLPAMAPDAIERALMAVGDRHIHVLRDSERVPGLWASLRRIGLPRVCTAMTDSPSAQVDRAPLWLGDKLRGISPWFATGILFEAHRLRRPAVPRRLLDAAGSMRKLDEQWEASMAIRACYEDWHYTSSVVFGPDFCVVEIPYTPGIPAHERVPLRRHMRELSDRWLTAVFKHMRLPPPEPHLAVSSVSTRRAAHVAMSRLDVGLSWVSGTARAAGCDGDPYRLVVERRIGDAGATPWQGRSLQAAPLMQTYVGIPNDDGLVHLTVLPPANAPDIARYNRSFALHPHRLFSLEVRRLQAVLESLGALYTQLGGILDETPLSDDVAAWTENGRQFNYAVDPREWCVQPLPHLWQEVHR